ncbi:sigma-70 family RNA polymerase sigma factor [Dactylosporangium sp. NPDC050688]|uniref:sigma-70 family RNA polymerase sigma factor n=1 Tax=Dactylosporangium sp. NPDC050688 TaxID=3157217 RepID=UPI00340D29E9
MTACKTRDVVRGQPSPHQGDQVAADDARMRELQAVHGEALYSHLLQLTSGDRRAAEDLLQETIRRAWQHIDASTDIRALRLWLLTMARQTAIDAGRARRARPTEVGTADPRRDLEQQLSTQVIEQAMAGLRPDSRAVIIELYFKQRSEEETAQALGIPLRKVRLLACLARLSLRAAISAHGLDADQVLGRKAV